MPTCAEPRLYIPPASQAALRADKNYIALLEAESTWAFKYQFTRPNPAWPRAFPIQGLNLPRPGPAQMDAYNSLLPAHFRAKVRASQNRPQTELFGTAPYVALGRGVMHHVDTNTALLHSNPVHERGSRVLTEREWDTRAFITVPRELRELPVDLRVGQTTRVAPSYLQRQPHDP